MARYGDNFSRPDNDALGSPWVESENVAGVLRVKNNKLNMRPVIGGVGTGGWASFNETYGNDHRIRVRCQNMDAWYYVVLRGSGTHINFTGYVAVLDVFGFFPYVFDIIKLTNFNWQTGNPFSDGVILAEGESVIADGWLDFWIVGTRIITEVQDANGAIWSHLEVIDAAISTGKAGVAVTADAAAGSPEADFDDVMVEDVIASTWTINDIAPIPLALQFEAGPAESNIVPFDIAPFEFLHDFATPPAPWSETWWGGPLSMLFGAPVGGLTVFPDTIPSAEAFGTPLVHQQVRPATITSAEAFGTPTIHQQVRPDTIPSAEAFGTPSIHQQIRPDTIASAESFGVPIVTVLGLIVQPVTILSAESFGTLNIVGGAEAVHPDYGAYGEPQG